MRKYKNRSKGDTFRPVVTVHKAKNGTPTKIMFNGQIYALVHADYINGKKSKLT